MRGRAAEESTVSFLPPFGMRAARVTNERVRVTLASHLFRVFERRFLHFSMQLVAFMAGAMQLFPTIILYILMIANLNLTSDRASPPPCLERVTFLARLGIIEI